MFQVEAYDKDNDDYEVFCHCDTFEQAREIGSVLDILCKDDRLLSNSKEPFDWVEIFSTKENEVIFIF